MTTQTTFPILTWDASIPYAETARRQEELVAERKECLILCEHPPTITLGTSATAADLALPKLYYERQGIPILSPPRGGKATYHGPGQLVVYPILDLRGRGISIHEYLRLMEGLMIETCAQYGIKAQSIDGKAGCWVGHRKIGFIGVRVRRGMAFHGISLNITPQQQPFRLIVPCGMPDLSLTSFQEEANQPLDLWDVGERVKTLFFPCPR